MNGVEKAFKAKFDRLQQRIKKIKEQEVKYNIFYGINVPAQCLSQKDKLNDIANEKLFEVENFSLIKEMKKKLEILNQQDQNDSVSIEKQKQLKLIKLQNDQQIVEFEQIYQDEVDEISESQQKRRRGRPSKYELERRQQINLQSVNQFTDTYPYNEDSFVHNSQQIQHTSGLLSSLMTLNQENINFGLTQTAASGCGLFSAVDQNFKMTKGTRQRRQKQFIVNDSVSCSSEPCSGNISMAEISIQDQIYSASSNTTTKSSFMDIDSQGNYPHPKQKQKREKLKKDPASKYLRVDLKTERVLRKRNRRVNYCIKDEDEDDESHY
ncbi:UNKNOWN [Stylonychia lemnae]|uniref:Uncharacterized protein n=1 Tax=Stylonychia lemnae TaxID=5949 RepID=A0A078B5C5_STYLE|nr:UNKNOWN [Stylonychia lemnae]|eukprot:CDW89629.1 UNKNOWN [Stylonychia lemnae]